MHPCKRGRCGENGTDCTWRGMLMRYIASGELAHAIGMKNGALTYLQVMKMHGRQGPTNPR
eukprot:5910656-Lingulodinium_polyedra.AAC.1